MVTYIKQIADELAGLNPQSSGNVFDLIRSLAEELERLDPRDFLPASRFNFVMIRTRARSLARLSTFGDVRPVKEFAKTVSACLDFYGGDGSRAVSRSFAFVTDAALRVIIERDYRELSLILLPDGAWKSVVVMSGSILEAILYDQLTKDSATVASAVAASKAPKNRDLSKGEWRLHDLIQVAVELGILPPPRAASIDQILRDYRNFVHPKKEIRSAHPCSEAEAFLSKGALDSVCNHLTP
jgi:hypothetical protein